MTEPALPADEPGRPSAGGAILAAAGLIAAVTLLSRAAGFARTLVFSHSVGATGVGEVYQVVNTLPNVVFEVAAGGVLAAVVVPLVAGRLGSGDREGADRIASALLTWTLTILVPLSVLIALAAPVVTRLMLQEPAGSDATLIGRQMLLVFAPQVPLYGIAIVLTGVLQAHRRFLAAALAPLLSSVVVMAAYLVFPLVADGDRDPASVPATAVATLAWGTTLGVVVLSLPLLVPAVRSGTRLRPTWRFPDGVARRAGVLAGAGLVALLAQQGAVLVTLWLAKGAGSVGTVNVYAYVQAVYLLPYAVLAVPIATSAFPSLAHSAGAGEVPARMLSWSLRAVLLVGGLSAAVLVAVARPVGTFFSGIDASTGGSTASEALSALPVGLTAYAPGLVGFGVAALLTRALYVRGRASLAGAAMAAGWVVAGVGPLTAVSRGAGPVETLRALGVFSSIGMTLAAVLLGLLVRRAWGVDAVSGVGRSLFAVLVSLAVALAAGDAVAIALAPTSVWGALGVGVVVAVVTVAVYVFVMSLADKDTVRALRERGRARRKG